MPLLMQKARKSRIKRKKITTSTDQPFINGLNQTQVKERKDAAKFAGDGAGGSLWRVQYGKREKRLQRKEKQGGGGIPRE
jgi:hypothetical protein